jgi:hypothetical protein
MEGTWTATDSEATKYSAEFIVTYQDGTVRKYTVSTSTTSASINESAIADYNADQTPDPIASVFFQVKSLNPGNGRHRQSNAFAGPVNCGYTA